MLLATRCSRSLMRRTRVGLELAFSVQNDVDYLARKYGVDARISLNTRHL